MESAGEKRHKNHPSRALKSERPRAGAQGPTTAEEDDNRRAPGGSTLPLRASAAALRARPRQAPGSAERRLTPPPAAAPGGRGPPRRPAAGPRHAPAPGTGRPPRRSPTASARRSPQPSRARLRRPAPGPDTPQPLQAQRRPALTCSAVRHVQHGSQRGEGAQRFAAALVAHGEHLHPAAGRRAGHEQHVGPAAEVRRLLPAGHYSLRPERVQVVKLHHGPRAPPCYSSGHSSRGRTVPLGFRLRPRFRSGRGAGRRWGFPRATHRIVKLGKDLGAFPSLRVARFECKLRRSAEQSEVSRRRVGVGATSSSVPSELGCWDLGPSSVLDAKTPLVLKTAVL